MQRELKQKLKRKSRLNGTLRKQSNKHEIHKRPYAKSKEQKITSCMPKTAVSPNFKTYQLCLAGPK